MASFSRWWKSAQTRRLTSLRQNSTTSVRPNPRVKHPPHAVRYYPERQRFTIKDPKGSVLKDGTLKENGIDDGTTLYFKDLGVQISWRLVFVLEYLGPILIFPFFYYAPEMLYNLPVKRSFTQKLALFLALFHFGKREFETLFIHRFSNATMPIHRLPVNCFHYWIICALSVGYFLFHPAYVAPINNKFVNLLLAVGMLACEYANLQTHIVLRNLRPRGSKARGVPHGWGFQYVSCANYLWETMAWVLFSLLIGTLTGWVFTAVAFGQMSQWALKKHRNYAKEMVDYPKERKAILPFIM